jgi:hypothetical protein
MKTRADAIMEAGQTVLDAWPRHPDGRPVKIGEMTPAQRTAVARSAVQRLGPEFASQGISLEFKDTKPPARTKADNKPKEFWTRGL